MARVTVEDCIEKVKNRFELILMASKRARDIEKGTKPSIPRDNDKPTIIALREIAEEAISLSGLQEITKKSLLENPFEVLSMQNAEKEVFPLNIESFNEIDDDEEFDQDDTNFETLEALDDESLEGLSIKTEEDFEGK